MKLHKKIKSKIDDSIKYIFFTEEGLAVESTFIDKHDSKNIICLPTQTTCCMKCKFCHITDIASEIILRNITDIEIVQMVDYIFNDLELSKDKMLLISFMGCGEPLLNSVNLIKGMILLNSSYAKIRFALATSMPKNNEEHFKDFVKKIKDNKLNVKLHLSLHYTNDLDRHNWMPNAEIISKSLELLDYYKKITNNAIEIHYTLINEVNDREEDIKKLISFFKNKDVCIKFIRYNSKNTINSTETPINKAESIMKILENNGIKTEYYIPPARDVGGSCGQILVKEYLKYNKKNIQINIGTNTDNLDKSIKQYRENGNRNPYIYANKNTLNVLKRLRLKELNNKTFKINADVIMGVMGVCIEDYEKDMLYLGSIYGCKMVCDNTLKYGEIELK